MTASAKECHCCFSLVADPAVICEWVPCYLIEYDHGDDYSCWFGSLSTSSISIAQADSLPLQRFYVRFDDGREGLAVFTVQFFFLAEGCPIPSFRHTQKGRMPFVGISSLVATDELNDMIRRAKRKRH